MPVPLASSGQEGDFPSRAVCSALRERDERLESLKAFAGKLAHDFRNTLVPLLGYAALIKEEIGENASVHSYALKLEAAARRLESDLDTILFAVRPERRFAPKPCDFSGLVKRVLDAWTKGLPKEASIQVESSLTPCQLVVDEGQWSSAIEQLLKNAQLALATGGTVEVALRARSLTPEQSGQLSFHATELIQLVVRDNGIGMTESLLKRACEPFFTTRPKGQAAGLGLTIAQSVAHLHGGQLVLESAPDAGTTVTIWLPALEPGGTEPR